MKARFLILAVTLVAACAIPAPEKTFDAGTDNEVDYVAAKATFNPTPEIPTTIMERAFKSYCVARFFIDNEGKPTVKLLTKSGSNEIDDITIATLRRWKFNPAMLDGKPVESTRRIRVEFEID